MALLNDVNVVSKSVMEGFALAIRVIFFSLCLLVIWIETSRDGLEATIDLIIVSHEDSLSLFHEVITIEHSRTSGNWHLGFVCH